MKFRNVYPGWWRPLPLACALAMSAPAAQADIQSSATLSKLSVKVIDLNTADKIKPSATWGGSLITVNTGEAFDMAAVSAPGTQALPESGFANLSYGAGKLSTGVALGSDALAQSTSLPGVYVSNSQYDWTGRAINPDTGLMTSYTDRYATYNTSVYSSFGQSVQSGYPVSDTEQAFTSLTLSAGTVAVVSGELLVSVTTDSTWLQNFGNQVASASPDGGPWGYLQATVASSIELSLHRVTLVSNPNGGSTTTDEYQSANASASDMFGADGVLYRDTSGLADPQHATTLMKQSFSLVVQNAGTQDAVFDVNLLQTSTVFLEGYRSRGSMTRVWDLASGVPVDATTPPVPNIPEPGTWMLMGMGLSGVAWARRRRTQQTSA